MNCRFCNTPLTHEFIDLGSAPPSNSFLRREQLNASEIYYPLKLYVCHECHLTQIDEYKCREEIFDGGYAYFSSFSSTWVEHARCYAAMITERLHLGAASLVMEVASNDGYLLRFFQERGIPCLGVEPALATAEAARAKGIEVVTDFFDRRLASELRAQRGGADLLIGNNVLAHTPDINGFVAGINTALADKGVVTMEFPHLMRLVRENQFDTIYHEHFSYLSFHTVLRIFSEHRLTIFDVEELPTHGGSLRIYAMREQAKPEVGEAVQAMLDAEREEGMYDLSYYQGFQAKAEAVKYDLLDFLIKAKRSGKLVAGYGAAAKGNTLLNYCGVKRDLIPFICDASEYKQGLFTPGTHIPILPPSALFEMKPDYVLVLPWNIKREIMELLDGIHGWGGRFVFAIPGVAVDGRS